MKNKNEYESIIILKGNIKETGYKKALQKIKDYFGNYEIQKIEEIGKKQLAYPVGQNTKGYFLDIYLKATTQDISNIEKFYKLNDDIVKYITLKNDWQFYVQYCKF